MLQLQKEQAQEGSEEMMGKVHAFHESNHQEAISLGIGDSCLLLIVCPWLWR